MHGIRASPAVLLACSKRAQRRRIRRRSNVTHACRSPLGPRSVALRRDDTNPARARDLPAVTAAAVPGEGVSDPGATHLRPTPDPFQRLNTQHKAWLF